MTLDELLAHIRQRQLILISDHEIWPAPGATPELKRAIRKHRRQLAALIAKADIKNVLISNVAP